MPTEEAKHKWRYARQFLRWGVRFLCVALLLAAGVAAGFFPRQIYHHFWLFPKQAAAWKALAAQRTPVALKSGWAEYRGIMHSHSHLSHDSEVPFSEILEALHKANCQFIFTTDHPVDAKADYSLGWRGMHDGVLFVPGFEVNAKDNERIMPWGLPEGTVIDNGTSTQEIAKEVRRLGGVLFFAHTESGDHPYDVPEIDGMEIYNLHTDLLDKLMSRQAFIESAKEVVNMHSFGDQTLRQLFNWQVLSMLVQKWDAQNLHRKLTGIAANDSHQNTGLQALYTAQNTLMLFDTGHSDPAKKLSEHKLNPVTRMLLRLCFGPLEPGKRLFRIDLDPYDRSARFVNTHLLAKDLTEPALLDALRVGRAFIAFNMIGDAKGFAYVAQGNGQEVTMGERIPLTPDLRLLAESPLPCQFILFQDGRALQAQNGKSFEFGVGAPGKYRIQANLAIPGEVAVIGEHLLNGMAPWVITNPIEVVSASAP